MKETRKKEIRQELLNTSKLKTFFEDNPRDLEVLRHDVPKHGLKPMVWLFVLLDVQIVIGSHVKLDDIELLDCDFLY